MGGAWAQTACQPSEGNGSEGSPYIITKAEELAWFRDAVNNGGYEICAKIADNVEVIDLKDFCHAADASQNLKELSWEPIGNSDWSYVGTFDGNGKTITNLYINATQAYMGLFGRIYKSTIKNLTFENANVTNTENDIGILAGYAGNGNTLQNIKISNTCQIKGGNDFTGGIAGYLDGNAYNCVNYATVQGTEDVGGLVGYFESGTIKDCANYGDITGTSNVGNLIGNAYTCNLNNVLGTGNVTATNTKPGGILVGIIENSSGSTASGILAYSSSAKLTINGTEQAGDAVKAIGDGSLAYPEGKNEADVIKAFNPEQLNSGEVAWLLNGSTSVPTEGSTLVWYQKLGDNADAYPVLKSTGDNTVYQAPLISCDGTTQIGEYANNPNGDQLSHNYQMATVADANGLYGGVCVECNSPEEGVKYIKDFCGILGNNLKLTYADGKYTAEAVTLTDGEAYNSPVDIEVADFKYIRTFDAYKWQSLYVPFRMSLEQLTSNGLNVATPVDIEVVNETITRLNVQKLKSGSSKANYPSLIMCESDGEKTIELADVTLSASKEKFIDCMSMTRKYVFNGVYQANKNLASNSEDAINYIIKDGGLVLRTDDDVPAPQSWYMNVTIRENPFGGADEPLSSDAKTMPIYVIGEGYATGIENVNTAEEHILHGIYDLQGRKLSQEPESGIYIKDGKKYVK